MASVFGQLVDALEEIIQGCSVDDPIRTGFPHIATDVVDLLKAHLVTTIALRDELNVVRAAVSMTTMPILLDSASPVLSFLILVDLNIICLR